MRPASGVEQDVPRQSVAALRAALGERLMAVVLFGSRARGDYREGSDWDLLVIAEGLPEGPFERRLSMNRALFPAVEGEISVLAKTPEEFEASLPPLYLDIALDGRILYDPTGYAAERLTELRRIMDRAGLYRERTPAGDVWEWRNPPSGRWAIEWER
jgi:predicted nucleotidyltransferase